MRLCLGVSIGMSEGVGEGWVGGVEGGGWCDEREVVGWGGWEMTLDSKARANAWSGSGY